ncbi:unnamed protein product [Soboliphyme baturini]|uniref:RING-type domain-containing protein n=1 Tax=Soboliphyme baturini TaxID=241478 RepID=A0A183IYV3_9BILA|nr:unnamed protein product [Soboliphyme baturini]
MHGSPVLFDIIQLVTDHMSNLSVPKLPCSICLCKFDGSDDVKLIEQCLHHFHAFCFQQYVQYMFRESRSSVTSGGCEKSAEMLKQVPCPLCRKPVDILSDFNAVVKRPVLFDEATDVSGMAEKWANRWAKVYEAQKRKGGIIDVEAQKKQLLITENMTVDIAALEQPSAVSVENAQHGCNTRGSFTVSIYVAVKNEG